MMVNSREWHARNRAESRRRAKEWRERNQEKRKAYNAAYRARNRDKVRAREAVKRAVRKGVLVRPFACERCQRPERLQAHHHDYRQPLVVEWICRDCHGQEHRRAA